MHVINVVIAVCMLSMWLLLFRIIIENLTLKYCYLFNVSSCIGVMFSRYQTITRFPVVKMLYKFYCSYLYSFFTGQMDIGRICFMYSSLL